jgi:3-oxoacyl-[acyl-carrier protein] reductase/pteridine reductase
MNSLEDKIILVTGAAKRIGRAIALRLAAENARVIVHYGNSEEEARRTAAECKAVALCRANLENVGEIEEMFRQIHGRFGRLDGLVNNAGRFTRFDPLTITEADWDAIHAVNLKSVFFCCQQAARIMKTHGGGRIVNLSSLGGLRPWAEHAHYCASKAGVIMLTKALAKAWAPEITVNSVAPGVIRFGEIEDRARELVKVTPAGRVGSGEEIADAVVFYLKASNFVTGEVTAVDGGLNLR